MKKVISLVLALTLVLALAVPAFAAGPNVSNASQMASGVETTITGQVEVGTIKVTVPTAAKIVVNPYNLEVKVNADGTVNSSGTITSKGAIISPTQRISSQSTMPIDVNVAITGTAEGDATFATASTRGATPATTKSVMLVFDMVPEAAAATLGTADLAADAWNVKQVVSNTGVVSYTGFDPTKSVIVSASEKKVEKICRMEATDGTKFSAAAFHFTGDAAAAPTNAWTSADKVGAKIVFTFTAANNAATT